MIQQNDCIALENNKMYHQMRFSCPPRYLIMPSGNGKKEAHRISIAKQARLELEGSKFQLLETIVNCLTQEDKISNRSTLELGALIEK